MIHAISVDMPCPTCERAVTATVEPCDPTTGPAGLEVTDVHGCPHADEFAMDGDFLDAAVAAAEESLARAYDDAMESEGDRERDEE